MIMHLTPDTWKGCPGLVWDGNRHWCKHHWLRVVLGKLRCLDGSPNCLMPWNAWRGEPLQCRCYGLPEPVENFKQAMLDALLDRIELYYGKRVSAATRRYAERSLRRGRDRTNRV